MNKEEMHYKRMAENTTDKKSDTMATSVKRMDIAEFQALGFLQEANRQFFHPLGVALEAIVEDDGSAKLGGVWDYRDDPEGMTFEPAILNAAKATKIAEWAAAKRKARRSQGCNANGIQRVGADPEGDELLFENEWLSVYERDGWYIYSVETRAENGELVAVLPYVRDMRGNVEKYLGRYEECPAHDDGMQLGAITGGVDHGSNPVDAAIQELWEEGGFRADADDLLELGTIRPLASSSAKVFLYGIDVTDDEHLRRTDSIGDGTRGEEGAYCDWITASEAVDCKSANMLSMVCRLAAHFNAFKE